MLRPNTICPLTGLLLMLGLAGCSDGSDHENRVVEEVVQALCSLPEENIEVSTTANNIEFVRTPDACFDNLEGYPFTPNYVEVEGLRYHYVDEGPGDGEVILMLHGQPTWSYLYRKMIPVLTEAGYRVIAPDHIGMGRSDKPVDPRVHQYDQQVQWNKAFIDALGLANITLFVQDWGSLIGLRIAGESPELFARVVIANGDLPPITGAINPFSPPVFEIDENALPTVEFFLGRTGDRQDQFQQWIDWAASAPHAFMGELLQMASRVELTEGEVAAYDAPFPAEIYRAGPRAFPSMIAGVVGQQLPALDAWSMFDKPFLALAGEFDLGLGSQATQNSWIARVPGSQGQDHTRYQAGHFIQEDVGEEIAAQVVEFMQSNPIPIVGPLFNLRYCEILLLSEAGEILEAQVYNTLGLNDCPQSLWDALDLGAITTQQGALLAARNGPRYWVLDQITPINTEGTTLIPGFGETTVFGELEMRLVATVELSSGVSGENQPYVINEVMRNTIFTFVAGRRIFELEDPDGGVYVMQSMSQMTNPELQLHDLISLDDALDLPSGWTFNTRILQEELTLVANGIARVITDDLSNTYQKME